MLAIQTMQKLKAKVAATNRGNKNKNETQGEKRHREKRQHRLSATHWPSYFLPSVQKKVPKPSCLSCFHSLVRVRITSWVLVCTLKLMHAHDFERRYTHHTCVHQNTALFPFRGADFQPWTVERRMVCIRMTLHSLICAPKHE
jgi:hypothetical protein